MAKQKNLKQKVASGMVWIALQKYSFMFIHFISGIILARLLTPYDYGCIGMLSIFMVLAEAFVLPKRIIPPFSFGTSAWRW